RARIQAEDPILDRIAGSQDKYRHVFPGLSKVLEHLDAVAARKVQVEHQTIEKLRRCQLEACFAGRRRSYLVPFCLQAAFEAAQDLPVVFHNQDTQHEGSSGVIVTQVQAAVNGDWDEKWLMENEPAEYNDHPWRCAQG